MDLREHVRALWALRLPLVLVAALLALAVGSYEATLPPRYSSTVALDLVTTTSSGDTIDAAAAADRFALIGASSAVLDDAARRAGLSRSEVDAAVSVTAPSAGLVQVTATSGTADAARTVVAAEAQALVDAVDQQERNQRDQDVAGLQARLSDVAKQLTAVPTGTDPGGLRTALTVQLNTLASAIGNRQSQIPLRLAQGGDPTAASAANNALRQGVLTFLLALVLIGESTVAVQRLRGRLLRGNWPDQVQRLTGSPLLAVVKVSSRGWLEPSGGLRVHLALRAVSGPDGLTLLPFVEDVAPRHLAREIARSAGALGRPGLVVDASHWRGERSERNETTSLVTEESADGAREVVLHSGRAPLDSVVREEEYVVLYGPAASDLHGTVALALLGSAPVLVLDSRSARVGPVREWAALLREAGCAPVGAIVLDRRVRLATGAGGSSSILAETPPTPTPVR